MLSTSTTSALPENIVGMQHDPRNPNLVNISRLERLFSLISGSTLALYGVSRLDLQGIGLAFVGAELVRRGLTGHDYLYRFFEVTSVAESPHTIIPLSDKRGITVRRSMTIARTPQDLYQFWRNVELAPHYMHGVEAVKVTGKQTSHWIAKLPTGGTVTWDSEITEDIPSRIISWQTTSGVPLLGTAGRVIFSLAPDDKGTIVTSEVDYSQQRSQLGVELGKLVGKFPQKEVQENLRLFKQLMEAGEIATISGQPVGQGQPLSQQGRNF